MTLVSNFTVSSVSRVLQRLQHSQPTMFCCSRLLNALPKKFQSNQPAISLAAEFDGCLCEWALDASTRFCKHVSTRLPKFSWILSLQLTLVTYVCWDRPRWSPSAMNAAALTHCAKIWGSIAENCKHLRRKKRHRESQTEKECLQQPRLQNLLPSGKEFQADLQRRPPRTPSPSKTSNTYL